MTPLLTGVFASQISGHLTPAFTPTGSYDAITSYTVGAGGVSTISFAGIPSGYKHLQLRITGRGGRAIFLDNPVLKFNGDTTTSNYYNHGMYGDGSSVSTSYDGSSYLLTYSLAGDGSGSNVIGSIIVDVLDYNSFSKNKTIRFIGGLDNNGTGLVSIGSGGWFSTAPVNSITLTLSTGASFQQHTKVSIYGVKG